MASPQFTTPSRPLTWLITGCSSGIGLSLTRMVLSQGHKVIATSRNPGKTPELVAEVEAQGGRWIRLDVMDPHCGNLISDLESQGTEIDVLWNNAGYSLHNVVEGFTEKEVKDQFETMLFGPYRLIRAVTPYLRQRRFGIIVTISSAGSIEGAESMGPYSAAKAGFDGLVEVLAKEIAQFNVRTLTCILGGFNTNMPNAIQKGNNPVPDDYSGSTAEQFMDIVFSGNFMPLNDKEKAAACIFDVVVGRGVGKGHLGEPYLPLGVDVPQIVTRATKKLEHAMDIFGDVCCSVAVDNK